MSGPGFQFWLPALVSPRRPRVMPCPCHPHGRPGFSSQFQALPWPWPLQAFRRWTRGWDWMPLFPSQSPLCLLKLNERKKENKQANTGSNILDSQTPSISPCSLTSKLKSVLQKLFALLALFFFLDIWNLFQSTLIGIKFLFLFLCLTFWNSFIQVCINPQEFIYLFLSSLESGIVSALGHSVPGFFLPWPKQIFGNSTLR